MIALRTKDSGAKTPGGIKMIEVHTDEGEWLGAVTERIAPLVEFAPELRNAAIGARKLLSELMRRRAIPDALWRAVAQIELNLENAVEGADGKPSAQHVPVGIDP